MGNTKSASVGTGNSKFNLDDVDLDSIDSTKSASKENKKTRKTKEYKLLRQTARAGIDSARRFQLWFKATSAKEDYAKMYNNICEDLFTGLQMEDFPQFPRFGSGCQFEQLSSHKALLHQSQRILLILAIEHDSLKYCPQLGYLVELMLITDNASESGVFSVCHSMLAASKQNNWYFRTDYFNSYIRIKTFLSIFEGNVSFVASYLKNNNMDISNMLGDGISSMFVEYLNKKTYLRLVDTFSVEGYKILFRVGVALLNHAQTKLVLCKNLKEFKKVLIEESRKLTPNELCTRAFKIYLTRNKFEKLDQFHRTKGFDDKMYNQIEDETYVRRWPTWNKETMAKSKILTKKSDFVQLWVWLPPGCHIGDYQMLFSTEDDGYKLSSLYDKCREKENLIIVIKTTKKEIIGVFVTSFNDPDDFEVFAPLKKRIKDPKMLLFKIDGELPKKQKLLNGFNKKKEPNGDKSDENKGGGGDDENKNDEEKVKFIPRCYYAKTADQYYHQSNFQLKNMHTKRELDLNDLVDILDEDGGDDDENKNNESNWETDEYDDADFPLNNKQPPNNPQSAQRIPVVFPSKESFIVGDGVDNCIYIDNNLNHGFSSKCKTFKSPSLVQGKNGEFTVSQMEVWCVE